MGKNVEGTNLADTASRKGNKCRTSDKENTVTWTSKKSKVSVG